MGTFIIKKTPSGAFNFSLLAANKQKIAVASQVYTTKSACKAGMTSLGKNAEKCIKEDRIEDKTLKNPTPKTCPKFEIYLDKAGMFRYRLYASNGESIAISEDGYKSKSGCINGMKSVSVNAIGAEIIDETAK
ncbi:MAG: YegP family protein [Clostridia bacterium]|nr:YegP family protein [Clostridia bacterium]